MAYIKMIQPEEAEGQLKEIYDDIIKKRGKLSEVLQIQSLNPPSLVNQMNSYMTIMFGQSPLTRAQREMIAVVVSAANDCTYCQVHHAAALNNFWKDDSKTDLLKKDFNQVELSETDKLLCSYAWNLTKYPGKVTEEKYIDPLKKTGLSDRSILDATLVIAFFNFANRMVLGLGAELEAELGAGFKYE